MKTGCGASGRTFPSADACAGAGYYTLPEIGEQAKDGWHETYTDRYGREIQVDIDADVFGEQTAPLIKAGFPQYNI